MSGAFTIYSSTPTLTKNLNEHPISTKYLSNIHIIFVKILWIWIPNLNKTRNEISSFQKIYFAFLYVKDWLGETGKIINKKKQYTVAQNYFSRDNQLSIYVNVETTT
jgi:hypothetical protein